MKIRRALAMLLGAIAIGAAAWGAFQLRKVPAGGPASETPTTRVKRGSVTIAVTARGELQGGNPEMLTAPAVAQDSLTVTYLRQPGELVQAGDTVAEFDTTQQEYNLREAEADLAEAQQRVIQAEAENAAADEEARNAVQVAKTQLNTALIRIRGNPVLSRNRGRENEIAVEAARNRLRQAEQDLEGRKKSGAAGLQIQRANESKFRLLADMARKNIESMTLKAKTTGYVNLQTNTSGTFVLTTGMMLPTIQIGDTIRPGMAVAQLFDLESWEVSAQIAELDRGHLSIGQSVDVSIVALAGKTYPGRVKSFGAASGNAWDRKFECRMSLERTGPELRPGMSARLYITAEKMDNVLWAPSQALFESDGRSFVYLRKQNGFTPANVALVRRTESQVVLTGLQEGDIVALTNPAEQSKAAAKQTAMKALSK